MIRVRVKVCGMREEEDTLAAVGAGADHLRFVVDVASSPRNLSVKRWHRLMGGVLDRVEKVVVTVKARPDIEEMVSILLRTLAPDIVQLRPRGLGQPFTPKPHKQERRNVLR